MKKIIFSIDNGADLVDYQTYIVVLGFLHNVGIKIEEAIGCYKGVTERCFICQPTSKYHYGIIKGIAKKFNQESILTINDLDMSILVYMDGSKREYVGHWRVVERSEAIKSNNFTYDIDRNRYYKAS